ncbi:exodeoxyribonuclease V subunit gamma [Aestuariimicrobium soli]|uniref:exodeoxyribonuclease V subunit gamma n=1 Tax=Aestuariimicrobium soli TaxID=2035834 RepID=UPI003EC03768
MDSTTPITPGTPPATGALTVRLCTRGETLAALVSDRVGLPLGDPFASQLVVVQGAGQARWLSQAIATRWGVTAGVDLLTVAQLRRRLRPDDDDPWAADALTLTLADVIAELLLQTPPPPWAEVLIAHLRPPSATGTDRPGRLWATAHRVARLFRRYSMTAPELVAAWSQGRAVGPGGADLGPLDRWQFELWRACVEACGPLHPWEREKRLRESVTAAPLHPTRLPRTQLPWARVTVAATAPVRRADRELVAALAGVTDLECLQLVAGSGDPVFAPLQTATELAVSGWRELGARVVDPDDIPAPGQSRSVLQRLQRSVLARADDTVTEPDASVQILRSHGLNRQVEVLREALCGAFADDPTLEPRDVVIVCPDVQAVAPLLEATFGDRDEPLAHPGHRLRVQVPGSGGAGPVNEVLARLFDLAIGRATAEDLHALVALQPVSRRFGFSADDHARIRDLVDKARLRWGLDTRTRSEHGMSGVPQGTWLNAIERLVAGAHFPETPLTWVGTALPVDDIEAGDLRLIGQLAELVSRVRWLDSQFATPAPASAWADWLVRAIELFVDLPWDQQWAMTATVASLRRWAQASSSAPLDQHDVRQVVAHLAQGWAARPSFGNGAVHVVGFDDLRGVPHRVVAVLGLDAGTFPRQAARIGDDLLPADVSPEDDPRTQSQGALLSTLMAARDRLLVVHQGTDQRTGASVEPPVAVTQIERAVRAVAPGFRARSMSLQPHSPVNFVTDPDGGSSEEPFSFDAQALAAAQALAQAQQSPPVVVVEPRDWRFPAHDALSQNSVALAELQSFWRHPARVMLRQALGTGLGRDDRASSLQVPLELWGLSEYTVGQTALEQLLAGASPEQARAAAVLGGDVPPGSLGEVKLNQVLTTAGQLATAAAEHTGAELDRPISLALGRWQLTGVVRLTGDLVTNVTYGRLNGSALLDLWLQVLACSVELDRPLRAHGVHLDSRNLVLQAPSPARCRDLLVDLLDWRGLGLGSVLLAPTRVLYLVGEQSRGMPPDERSRLERSLTSEFRRLGQDPDWQPFLPTTLQALLQAPAHADLPLSVADLGERLFAPMRKAMVQQ